MAVQAHVAKAATTVAGRAALMTVVVLGAVVLALGIPTVQKARLTQRCAEYGGLLQRSTEDLEPVAIGRTVYRCCGPRGHVLVEW